jgi:MafB19-like deaminase
MSSASQPALPVSLPTEHWTELSIVDRILRAADWPELKRWAEVALGPSSFELGVCCGIVENIAGSVIGVLDLLKTFILAGLYARARQGLPWWDVVGLPEYLVAKGAELVLGAELKKAHDTCEALMRQVMYVVKHPREFLKTTKDNYLRQYTQKWELFQRLSVQTDLTSQFRAGEIFGEVLLDVLMLVMIAAGAAEAAAKLAGEVPELVKLAENLKGVLKVKPGGLRAGGAAADLDAVEDAEGIGKASSPEAPIKDEAAKTPTVDSPRQIQYLADRRKKLGLPPAGSLDDNATLAKLEINGQSFDGINSSLQDPRTNITLERVNAQTKTHAEAEAVQKAVDSGMKGTTSQAEMWVDRDPCAACGESGGLRSLARNLGVDKLIVHSPSGTQIFAPTK